MKKLFNRTLIIFISGLFLFSSSSFAQDILQPTDEKTYTEYMDKVLESVKLNDASEFKNGILYDRVFSMARLDVFNQTDSTNTSSYNHFERAWQELYTASLNPDFFTPQLLDDIAYHFERENIIQIGIINIDFTQIDSTALKQDNPKLEIVNQKIQRIANINPYKHKHTTVVSVMNSETIFGNSVEFEFGKIFLNKSDKQIKSLSAFFENNQSFSIIENGIFVNPSITVNFQENGLKEIAFDIEYSDGTFLTTYAMCQIALTPPDYSQIQNITATEPFQGVYETSDCNGSCFGKGEYKVYLANGHSEITKPYIIVDGFDPNDKRKISSDEAVDDDDQTIYTMMDYNNGNDNLVLTLKAQGFDVIILSFPKFVIGQIYVPIIGYINIYRDGGADYIQRNAKVLEALINEVNSILTNTNSNEKLIVAGPSMGALVSQYALVEMEQNGENHNVGLWVSFDGPHRGANISIGMQKALEYFDFSDGLYALRTIAARQMLIDHYLSYSSGYPAGALGYRNSFQNELNNMGFPQQCRNIAVLNGSITGAEKGIVEGNMIYAELVLGSGFLQRSGWVNYTSNSGNKMVFRYLKKNWWGANTQSDTKKYRNTSSSFGSLDNSPGGFFATKSRVEDILGGSFPYFYFQGIHNIPNLNELMEDAEIGWFKQFLISIVVDLGYINLTDDFSFVPTKSAIAYSGTNSLWRENIGCKNLVCTGETPFDSYYAPADNQAHASIHVDGVNWLLQEFNGNNQEPSVYGSCGTTTISGDNKICYNQTKTYELSNQCSSGNVTWTTSSNLQTISSNNTEITVKSINSNTGSAWIRATLSNGQSTTKQIIGKPLFTHEATGNGHFIDIDLVSQVLNFPQQGITSVTWTQTGGTGTLYATNNSLSAHAMGSHSGGWYVDGIVEVSNSCGLTERSFHVVSNGGDPCDPLPYERSIIIIPESQNVFKVIDPCEPENPQYIDQSELYNAYGVKLQNLNPQQDIIDINNTSNSGSIRIIKAESNGKIATKRVLVD